MKSKFVESFKTTALYTARFVFVTSPLLSLTLVAGWAGFKPARNLIEGTIDAAKDAVAQTIVDMAADTK